MLVASVAQAIIQNVARPPLPRHAPSAAFGEQIVTTETLVHFEQSGSQLTAVEIDRASRSPLIGVLHGALFALGIVVSSYRLRAGDGRLVERIVLECRDGGGIDGALNAETKALILPLALYGQSEASAPIVELQARRLAAIDPGGEALAMAVAAASQERDAKVALRVLGRKAKEFSDVDAQAVAG